jgi:O-antigen/teichoic acid export membrane protein
LSINSAISVNYFHLKADELKVYIGNAFFILLVSLFLVFCSVYIFEDIISTKVVLPKEWLYISIIVAFMSIISQINLTLWRVKQEAKPFVLYSTMITILNISISLLLVVGFKWHWLGRVEGISIANTLFGIISMIFIFKRGYIKFIYNIDYIKDALKLGISILPHYFAQWLRVGFDIFLITYLLGVAQTGEYALGYQFGAIIGILAGAFNTAFSAHQMEKLKSIGELDKIKMVKFSYLFFILFFIFSIVFAKILYYLFGFMIDEKFLNSREYIMPISIAYSFQGMYFIVLNYLMFNKKNHLISLSTITATFIQIVCSYVAISYFGVIGATYATIIGFLLNFVLIWYFGSKVYPMPWGFWYKEVKDV